MLCSQSEVRAQQIILPTSQLEVETETGTRCRSQTTSPSLNVSGGNYAPNNIVGQEDKGAYGLITMTVPLFSQDGKNNALCQSIADLEAKKKKLDIYLELMERGLITESEVDALRKELFPQPKSYDKQNDAKVRPQATVRANDHYEVSVNTDDHNN
jgi:hypothetical protein